MNESELMFVVGEKLGSKELHPPGTLVVLSSHSNPDITSSLLEDNYSDRYNTVVVEWGEMQRLMQRYSDPDDLNEVLFERFGGGVYNKSLSNPGAGRTLMPGMLIVSLDTDYDIEDSAYREVMELASNPESEFHAVCRNKSRIVVVATPAVYNGRLSRLVDTSKLEVIK